MLYSCRVNKTNSVYLCGFNSEIHLVIFAMENNKNIMNNCVSAAEKVADLFAFVKILCNNTIQYNTIQYNTIQ